MDGRGEIQAYFFTSSRKRDYWVQDASDGSGRGDFVVGGSWVVAASSDDLARQAQQAVGGRLRL